MRVSRTIRPETRAELVRLVQRAQEGAVLVFIDRGASAGQMRMVEATLTEMARRVNWHGRRLTRSDWRGMLIATLRHNAVIPGLDEGSVVVLGDAREELSAEEASNMIEAARAVAAQQGVVLSDLT